MVADIHAFVEKRNEGGLAIGPSLVEGIALLSQAKSSPGQFAFDILRPTGTDILMAEDVLTRAGLNGSARFSMAALAFPARR